MLDLNLPLKIFFMRVISIWHQKYYCFMATLQKYTHKKVTKKKKRKKAKKGRGEERVRCRP